MKIAVLEQDVHDARLLEEWLRSAGHTARVFVSGSDFTREHNRERYDLVIIGATCRDMGGTEIIVALRERQNMQVPIIRMLKNAGESAIVAALKAGADDCIAMPHRQLELLARVEALVRRAQRTSTPTGDRLQFGALCVDVKNRVITRDGARVTLTPKAYSLALYLLTNTGQLLTRTHMIEYIWGKDKRSSTRTLDTHISRLRTVLGLTPANGWQLQSVYQHGYRLDHIASGPALGSVLGPASPASSRESCCPG